jgi:hypothetical protein
VAFFILPLLSARDLDIGPEGRCQSRADNNGNIKTDIDPLAKVLWPISVSLDDSDPDMEKGMH